MALSIFWALILLLIPMMLIALAQAIPILDKIGIVVLAFASGLLFSIVYQPQNAMIAESLAVAKTQVAEICIALAIPMLLFSIHIPTSIKLASSTIKVMLLACLSVCVAAFIAAFLFHTELAQIGEAAAMVVGAYTGGGQNIAAVKAAINADESLFIDILTYDMLLSSLFLLAAISVLKPIARRFLSAFQAPVADAKINTENFIQLTDDSAHAFTQLLRPAVFPQLLLSVLLAGGCVALALLLSKLVSIEMQSAMTIISLTTLGALLSFVPAVRRLQSSYRLGMLLIVIFCFTSGSMADSNIVAHFQPYLFGFIGVILLIAVSLHALLCRIFRVDVDTFIITITAAVMSVPFIPMVSSSIKNKALLFPGIAAAVAGYILGNYLGILMHYLLEIVLP